MARAIQTIGATVVVALGTAATAAAAVQQARSPAAPAVSAEYRSYVSWLQSRAWAEAAEQAARDVAAVRVGDPGSAWPVVGVGAGAAAALALAGGSIVLGRRNGGTALRPRTKSL
jgi:hypothetical protein